MFIIQTKRLIFRYEDPHKMPGAAAHTLYPRAGEVDLKRVIPAHWSTGLAKPEYQLQ